MPLEINEAKPENASVDSIPVSQSSTSSKDDDFDFSDLDLEEKIFDSSSKEIDAKVEQQPNNAQEQAIKEEVIKKEQDMKNIQESINKVESKPNNNDLDFDFESELMGNNTQASAAVGSDKTQFDNNQQIKNIEIIPNNQASSSENALQMNSMSSQRILSDSTVKQVSDSVKRLIDAKNVVAGVANFSQSPALIEIAAQLMEPRIDKWFNDNLPELVEKIVREEIKKLIPKE